MSPLPKKEPIQSAAAKKPAYLYVGRKAVAREEGKAQAWLVTFSDMMALMLTFFVLTYAMSEPKKDGWVSIVTALQMEFSTFQGMENNAGNQEYRTLLRRNNKRALDLDYLQAIMDEWVRDVEGQRLFARDEEPMGIAVNRLRDRLVLSIPASALFEAGGASLSAQGLEVLGRLSSVMRRVKNKAEMVGYAAQGNAVWETGLVMALQAQGVLQDTGYDRPVATRARIQNPPGLAANPGQARIDVVFFDSTDKPRSFLTILDE